MHGFDVFLKKRGTYLCILYMNLRIFPRLFTIFAMAFALLPPHCARFALFSETFCMDFRKNMENEFLP